ncbi:MAG: hypothetical protein R3A52_28730 [Polyangiales bacterium]
MKRRQVWVGVLALVGCIPTITVLPDDVPDAATEDVASDDRGFDVSDGSDAPTALDVASDVMDASVDGQDVATTDLVDAGAPDAATRETRETRRA